MFLVSRGCLFLEDGEGRLDGGWCGDCALNLRMVYVCGVRSLVTFVLAHNE